jgi:hypothetical protein
LSKHDIAGNQIAYRKKTQASHWAVAVVQLSHVCSDAVVDAISLSRVATGDIEIVVLIKLRALFWR